MPKDSKYNEYLVSQRQFRVSFDEDQVYVPYLVYYFHTREGQSKILAFKNQTGVPALAQPLKNFKNIEIDLPSLEFQKKQINLIERMQAKIDLNNQINKNLEQQIQEIFRSRFLTPGPSRDGWKKTTLADVSLIGAGEINQKLYLPFKPQNIHIQFILMALETKAFMDFQVGTKLRMKALRSPREELLVMFACAIDHIPR
nr:restriction endonuclease subunit S [Allobaculum sp. Allo2]